MLIKFLRLMFVSGMISSSLVYAETIVDNFDNTVIDAQTWTIANGWGNGDFTNTFWLKSQIQQNNGKLTLELSDTPCLKTPNVCNGKANAGAEIRSNQRVGLSSVSASIKTAKGEGAITALFKYTGPYDGDPHDEIDIEILGKTPRKAQLNYWVDGISKLEKVIDLGFDSSKDFHHYGWKQSEKSIIWTVDGKEVHRVVVNSPNDLPTSKGKIMMSLWAAKTGSQADKAWAGDISKTELPVSASFDWIRIDAR